MISGIFFIRSISRSANFKTKIWRIYISYVLSGRSSLYMISFRIFAILKGFNFVKFNLLLSLVVQINIIFMFNIFYRRCILFFFLRVGPQTLFLLVNFFITLLKNIRLSRSLFYNLWILSIYIIACGTNSLHFCILSKTSTLNLLFSKNRLIFVVLCLEVFRQVSQ